jgi:hypothetical protein
MNSAAAGDVLQKAEGRKVLIADYSPIKDLENG